MPSITAGEGPPTGHRLRIAKLRYLDQIGNILRQKYPELDVDDPPRMDPNAPPEESVSGGTGADEGQRAEYGCDINSQWPVAVPLIL